MNRYENLDAEYQNLSVPINERVPIPEDVNAAKYSKIDPNTGKPFPRLPKGEGTRSIFNRYSIFFLNEGLVSDDGIINPLSMDYKDNNINWRGTTMSSGIQDISTKNLINIASDGLHNAMDYEWSDFLYTRDNEIIPNNRLITLRRFATPVADNLLSKVSCPTPDMSRAVAWIDGEHNKMEELLKFAYNFNWKELESELQAKQAQSYGREGAALNSRSLSFVSELINGDTNRSREKGNSYSESFDPLGNATNLELEPLNVIKKMFIRKSGLDFQQKIKIRFDYDLKSYDGIDPRVAFIDLISNILLLTFERGQFWGGDIRWFGGRQKHNLLGNDAYSKFAQAGGADIGGGFKSALVNLIESFSKNLGNTISQIVPNLLSGIGNLLIGSTLDKIGRPELLALQALLTGESTGNWHLTIGNPLAPIFSSGNMILKSSELKFDGTMGHHDFPTKLILECELEHGRPRDRSDIMSLFAPQVGRTYYTEPPNTLISAMNRKKGNYGSAKSNSVAKEAQRDIQKQTEKRFESDLKGSNRFPNHLKQADGVSDTRISWAAQHTT